MNILKQWLKCSVALLLTVLSLTACAVKPPSYKIDCEDSRITLPALDSSYRQLPKPQWCSPTCSAAVAVKDRNSQELLMNLMPEE